MSLVKHKGSQFWYYSFRYNNKPYFGSTKTTNKALAKRVEEEKRRQVIEETQLGVSESITIKEALELFTQSKKHDAEYKNVSGRITKLIGYKKTKGRTPTIAECYGFAPDKLLHTLQTKDVQRYVMARKDEGYSDATIIYELGLLNRTLKLLTKLGYRVPELDLAEIRKDGNIKPPKGRIRYLSFEEEQLLLAELDPQKEIRGMAKPSKQSKEMKRMKQDAYDFAVMLLDFGGRHTELSHLEWSAVNLEDGTIELYRSKVDNESILCMTDRVKAIFERRARSKRVKQIYVFENKKHGPRNYNPRAFKSACARAGLDDVSFHTCRHTFCSTLVANGATLFEVQQLVGHSTPTMTNRYAHLAPNVASSKAVQLLNRRHEAPATQVE